MPHILELAPLHQTRLQRQRRVQAFQRLHAGHFIGTNDVHTLLMQTRCLRVKLAEVCDLLIKFSRICRLGIQPVATAVRLQFQFILKNARHGGRKYSRTLCA